MTKDEAIKQALGALENNVGEYRIEGAKAFLRQALEQPEPEPAAYGYCPECGAKGVMRERRPNGNDTCEKGHVYPSNKPFGWILDDKFYKVKQCRLFSKNPGEEIPNQIPVYTSPPKREWQGLTDDEITKSHSYSRTRDKGCFHAGALWAQEKLKEKNT